MDDRNKKTSIKLKSKKNQKLAFIAAIVILVIGLLYINKQKTVTCKTEDCLTQRFGTCSPATQTYSSPNATVKYHIIGPKGSSCIVSFEYIKVSDASLQGQPMTCDFNSKEGLQNSLVSIYNNLLSGKNSYSCTGPLVGIIQSEAKFLR